MTRPAVVRNLGVDRWPLFLMSSSGKSDDSLVAGLWQSVFILLSSLSKAPRRTTFDSLFDEAVCMYHKENVYNLLNECKERSFSHPVWQLTFYDTTSAQVVDPWHQDLQKCLLADRGGRPNHKALQEMQAAYTCGKAFRTIHRRYLNEKGVHYLDGYVGVVRAQHPDNSDYYVVWAALQQPYQNTKAPQWTTIPHSRPYPCRITAWQGRNAGCEVDLANDVAARAFDAVAKPELVCGEKSGIKSADVFQTLF